ncbi:MAG: type 4a pilus biogenesis protein PilO [Chlamydiota bacterium]
MPIEKKKIELIAVAVIFSLLAVIVAWQMWPSPFAKGSKGREKQESPGSYRDQLLKAEMMVLHLPQQRAEVVDLQSKIDTAANDIPMETDQTWLSRQINAIARQSGVGDVSQRFIPVAAGISSLDADLKAKYAEKTWEIKMQCGYHELGKFLAGIEGTNRFIEITDVSIEGNEPTGQKVVLLVRYLVRKGFEAKPVAAETKK